MKSSHAQTSSCRRCRYYVPEGRRGGHCDQLNASVQGGWEACSLAAPAFETQWELTKMLTWADQPPAFVDSGSIAQIPGQKAHFHQPTRLR